MPSKSLKEMSSLSVAAAVATERGGEVQEQGSQQSPQRSAESLVGKQQRPFHATTTDVPRAKLSEALRVTATHSSLFPSHRSLGDKLGHRACSAAPGSPTAPGSDGAPVKVSSSNEDQQISANVPCKWESAV